MSQEFKQVDRNIMSEATFNAQKSNLPLGAVVDITDGIKMADLDSTLQNTINGKTKLYKHLIQCAYNTYDIAVFILISASSTAITDVLGLCNSWGGVWELGFSMDVSHLFVLYNGIQYSSDGQAYQTSASEFSYRDFSGTTLFSVSSPTITDTITEL